jgi:hypothetical protein
MLTIHIPKGQFFNNKTQTFFYMDAFDLQLEHSLISLSKWEAKWLKPFLTDKEKTPEELLDYVRCMTINKKVDPLIYDLLTEEHFIQIRDYINSPMTATWFSDDKKRSRSREIITAEIIYYWMIASNIPPEYQKWHLNRLLTLIKVCSIKNTPPKKMNKKDVMRQNSRLNAARRHAAHSRG